jgi:hypothetical protein
MADIQGGLNSTSQAEDQTLQTPSQEEIVQPTKLQTAPEDSLVNESISDYKKQSLLLNNQIRKMIDSYGKRTSMVNPKLAALSEGLGSDTPFFGTAFSKGIAGMARADAEEKKQMSDEAKMRMELIKAGQELSQKEIIAQLAPKLFKVDANGAFTGEIDNAIAQKMVSLTGDVGIIQKVIEMTKPQIGELAPGAVTYNKKTGEIISKNPKEATPSELKKKEDELAKMKEDLAKDPTNETLKRNVKYHEDELKKLDQLEFPDEVLTMLAQQALAGDTSVFTNVGRGTQGPNNLVRLRTKMNEIMKANGMTPEDIAAKNAEFFGIKAGERTVGTRGANVQLAAQGFLNIVPLATAASQKVYRSKLLPAGKVEVFFDENVNDPDLSAFAAYNNGIVNTYARAISPTGVPTVKDKEHARKIISEAKNHTAYMAAINALENEIEAEKRAPKEVRESIRSEITGKTPSSTATKSSATQPSGKHYLNNREIVVKGNKWVYADTGEAVQ